MSAPSPSVTKHILISDIRIGERHRKDFGDLQALADSIACEGLLQPIAVTEQLELVAGDRRVRAMQMLGRTKIAAHIVSVTSIIAGEWAENVIRKEFTVSERVTLAEAVAAQIGNRQGQRTDIKPDAPNFVTPVTKLEANDSSKITHGDRSAAVVANLAGFISERSYRDAKTVVERGSQELKDAVDSGMLPVTVAAELTALDPEAQSAVLKDGRLSVQGAAKALRHMKAVEREKVVPRFKVTALLVGTFPCTIPNCKRGPDNPFTDAGSLGNHRFTAHGIRSTNHESVARQARRDREREERTIAAQPKAPVAQIKPGPNGVRQGPLDRGERQMLHKKVIFQVGIWAREFQRTPTDVAAALIELCDNGLQPVKAGARGVDPDGAYATSGG